VNPRRLKYPTMLAGVVLSGLTLLTWTGQWFSLTIDGKAATQSHLTAAGDVAAPALVTLALAGLALVGALAIAGPVIRSVLGAVQTLLGLTVVLSAVSALRDPVAASASLITNATGVSGAAPVAALVRSVSVTAWPAITVVGHWTPTRDALSSHVSSLALAAEMRAVGVDIVIVCLGKPRQEKWIDDFGAATGAGVLLAFGAVVDFLAGRVSRAPRWVCAAGFEWMWRLMLEPRRLARRYLIEGPPAYMAVRRSSSPDRA
jgi:exopolysaccharide biosynthesis WecB/TagA/CpsF family protein